MIPVTALHATTLDRVAGPAILLPAGAYSQTFLVTAAEPPMALFLDGQYRHHAFRLDQASNWKGASVGPVRFEVDKESIYSTAESGHRLGTIVIKGDYACFIVGRVKDGGWTDTRCMPLVGEAEVSPTTSTEEVGFSRWRATYEEGESRIPVFEFSADDVDGSQQSSP